MRKARAQASARPRPPALVLRCGCEVAFEDGAEPRCPVHGVVGVASVTRMPAPRIRGVASGPLVTTVDLEPWTGRFAGSESKESG